MKKIGLLLASLGAGLLLVGGTVAAYIVTSADTLGARVSPGNLNEDADGHITLDWGSRVIQNVSGLQVGTQNKQQIAELSLTASSTDIGSTPEEISSRLDAFHGNFTVEITNQSNPGSGPDLTKFLSIKTYKYNGEAYPAQAELTGAGTIINAHRGDKYKTEVELLSQSTDEEPYDTADVFDTISQQIVYVSFSWGPDSSSADVKNVRTIYFVNNVNFEDDEDDDLFFYAYNGGTVNKSFPGVKMDKVYETEINNNTYDVYAIEFDASKYTNYNFNNGDHGNEIKVAAPASPLTALTSNPGYVPNTGWGLQPTEKLALYYVRGSIGGVDYWSSNDPALAMVSNTQDSKPQEYIIRNLTLHSGDEIKVYCPSTNTWYGPNDNWKITADGNNYVVCVDPASVDDETDWIGHMWCGIPTPQS